MRGLVGSPATEALLLKVEWEHVWRDLLLRLLMLPQTDMRWLYVRALLPESSTRSAETSMHPISPSKTQQLCLTGSEITRMNESL